MPSTPQNLSQLVPARWLRFLISGGASTLAYGALSLLLTFSNLAGAFSAHVIAYLACIPLSYCLQRVFTFGYQGAVAASFTRFAVVNGACFAAASLVVALFTAAGFAAWVGTLAVMVVIPVVGYLSMRLWVFAEGKPKTSSADLGPAGLHEDSSTPGV